MLLVSSLLVDIMIHYDNLQGPINRYKTFCSTDKFGRTSEMIPSSVGLGGNLKNSKRNVSNNPITLKWETWDKHQEATSTCP